MAHFAEIGPGNLVTRVAVIPDEQESRGADFLAQDLALGGTWIQTSYNTRRGVHVLGGTPLRKNYAETGFTYDAVRDAFIPPKPPAPETGPDWVLDEATCWWVKP